MACCIDALFAYFLCIVSSYAKATMPKEDTEDSMEDTKPLMIEEDNKAPSNNGAANNDAGDAMGMGMGMEEAAGAAENAAENMGE